MNSIKLIMKSNIQVFLISIIFLIIITGSSKGSEKFLTKQPKDSIEQSYLNGKLNGHRFLSNSIIRSPFVRSYLQNKLGAGQTVDLKIPPVIIDSHKVLQLKGQLVYTQIDIEYQQAIRDWMAFRARVIINGRLGTETGALISEGLNVSSSYEFGWLFNLYHNKKFALSGEINLFNTSFITIDLEKFIQGVIDSGAVVPSNKLVSTVPSLRAGGKLLGSYAFNKSCGLTVNLNTEYGETIDRKAKGKVYFEYGAAFDYDFLPEQKVPIGLLAGFYHNELPTSTQQIENEPNNFLFSINYTGRQNLNLGLEINYQIYKPADFDESIKFTSAALNMRYFF